MKWKNVPVQDQEAVEDYSPQIQWPVLQKH